MQNLTLQQLFGQNATQTSETLTIHKADLQGLTANTNNRGEQILAALLLQAHQHFEGVLTDEQGRAVTDERGRAISYDNRVLYEKLNISFWKRQILTRPHPKILDTFLVELFIIPPPDVGIELDSDAVSY